MATAETRFSIVTTGNRHDITWINNPLDAAAYTKIVHWIKSTADWSLKGPDSPAIVKFTAEINHATGSTVTASQVVACRNILLKQKIIHGYTRVNMQIPKIAAEYAKSSILALSTRYDFPPLSLLRGILITRGYNESALYKIFANKTEPDILAKRDLAQFQLATRNDAESTFNQQMAAKVAADNENTVVAFMRSLGIHCKTQDDLTAVQMELYGRPVLTPDILFIDQVWINGTRVHWIDYKDYIGTNVGFLYKSNSKQAAKYAAEWGPGAMCYHRGYVSGLEIPKAILLDATALPILLA